MILSFAQSTMSINMKYSISKFAIGVMVGGLKPNSIKWLLTPHLRIISSIRET